MKVLQLLDELEDIIENSSGLPLTGKTLVDGTELLEIVKEIRVELPDEIQQAQWIKDERQRIFTQAQNDADQLIREAKLRIEEMVESDELSMKARMKAEEVLKQAESAAEVMKKNSLVYVDGILEDFQDKMGRLNKTYVENMFETLQQGFNNINDTVEVNRTEVRKMLFPNGDPNTVKEEVVAEEPVMEETSQLDIMDIEEV